MQAKQLLLFSQVFHIPLPLPCELDRTSMSSQIATPEQAEAQRQALLNGPAAPPPFGTVSNFEDPANLNTYLALTIALCFSLGTFSVVLRTYTKKYIIRLLAYEDCMFRFGGKSRSFSCAIG